MGALNQPNICWKGNTSNPVGFQSALTIMRHSLDLTETNKEELVGEVKIRGQTWLQ